MQDISQISQVAISPQFEMVLTNMVFRLEETQSALFRTPMFSSGFYLVT